MLTAAEIMTEDVVTIGPDSLISEAIELLLIQQISGMPVTDNDGQLIGIVTEFVMLGIAYDDNICQDSVSKHMTTELLTVDIDDPISKVADICITHRVRRLPVVKDGRLVGLIARRDVLQAMYEVKVPACAV